MGGKHRAVIPAPFKRYARFESFDRSNLFPAFPVRRLTLLIFYTLSITFYVVIIVIIVVVIIVVIIVVIVL